MESPGTGQGSSFSKFSRPCQELLERYAAAFQTADIDALTRLLAPDIRWEMPPDPIWFEGLDEVAAFLSGRMRDHGALRSMATMANGQPAFAFYSRQADGSYLPHALHVLTLTGTGISRIVAFSDPRLFPLFGMPPTAGP